MSAQESAEGALVLIDKAAPRTLSPIPLHEVALNASILRPRRNVLRAGKNYHENAHEFASSGLDSSAANRAVPKHAIIFSKVPECASVHQQTVRIDRQATEAVDCKAEFGSVIGRAGRTIPHEAAVEHVWGYATVNDVAARSSDLLQSIVDREVAGHVLPDAAASADARRDRSRRHLPFAPGSAANCAGAPTRETARH